MISLLSLITFLLRLTLAIQGQLVAVLPAELGHERVCLDLGAPNQQVHPVFHSESGNQSGLVESEKEERNETETESLVDFLESLHVESLSFDFRFQYNPFFGSKGLQGDRHLYDLFHSWKTHLS
jgi:hypothetical protein